MRKRKKKSGHAIETFSKVSYLQASGDQLDQAIGRARTRAANDGARIEHIPLGDLTPWTKNPRLHSKRQVRQLARAIETFGFTNPILVDAENHILAGHGRAAAAQLLGMDRVPCLRIENMTAAQKRAYVIADNKLALNASWDEQILAEELQGLITMDVEFSLDVTGFSIPEIDGLIEGLHSEDEGDPDDDLLPDIPSGPAVAQPGDVWVLGDHALICGAPWSVAPMRRSWAATIAQAVITDPPYNVPIAGNVAARRHPA